MAETTQPTALRTDSILQLPLPAGGRLTSAQSRGATCAWCHTPLTAETAVDAGERTAQDGTRIWPRGCAPCAGHAAYQYLFQHASACDRCQTDPSCPTAVAARRLMREAGR